MGFVYTIGHSNHEPEGLVELLRAHSVTAVCDVRSMPYSKMQQQFNREPLKAVLRASGLAYVFLGRELGARSEDASVYRNGRVDFQLLAQTSLFRAGLERVRQGMASHTLALMCTEKEPIDCHRTILVSRRLVEFGIGVRHIHADGAAEPHEEAMERLLDALGMPHEDLFRSHAEILEDAYQRQGARIAYQTAEPETEPGAPLPVTPNAEPLHDWLH